MSKSAEVFSSGFGCVLAPPEALAAAWSVFHQLHFEHKDVYSLCIICKVCAQSNTNKQLIGHIYF